MKRTLAALTFISALSGCGGGGGDSTPASTTSTGLLTDSLVAGVQYETSSGLSGITNSAGQFQYKPGDTVTFRLGKLKLGVVTLSGGSATVTPLELSGGAGSSDPNKLTNLLVLLQSLDRDGNPANGLSIPAEVRNVLDITGATLPDLTLAPEAFTGDGILASLVSTINTGGGTAAITTSADALEHFRLQFMSRLAGTWVNGSGNSQIVIRIDPAGNYVHGEHSPDSEEDGGADGIERGKFHWDSASGRLTADSITLDTNGTHGFSNPGDESWFVSVNQNVLNLSVRSGSAMELLQFTRVMDNGIQGTWIMDETHPGHNKESYVYLPNGTYWELDEDGNDDCPNPGIELARYNFSAGILHVFSPIAKTNQCPGETLDESTHATINASTGVMTWSDGDGDKYTLYRPEAYIR